MLSVSVASQPVIALKVQISPQNATISVSSTSPAITPKIAPADASVWVEIAQAIASFSASVQPSDLSVPVTLPEAGVSGRYAVFPADVTVNSELSSPSVFIYVDETTGVLIAISVQDQVFWIGAQDLEFPITVNEFQRIALRDDDHPLDVVSGETQIRL